jgi:cytochrome c-type biogenesis protein CcmH
MTLGLILALMTAVAIAAVVWPLLRHGVAARSGSDVVVYRDQLDEVGRDLAAGLIGKTEADAARVEISRRLLAAVDAVQNKPAPPDALPAAWRRWAIAAVSLLLLPVGAAGLYLRLGSPGLASEPLTARMEAPASNKEQSVEKLIAEVEKHLQSNPQDGHGWEVLAPVYMQLGRYTDSANAWRNAIRILGQNADREADLGEALVAEANGVVTKDAKAAFVRSVTLDSTTVSAQFYLGLAAEQDGKREQAAKIWRELIAGAPAGANWVATVRTALARVEGKAAAPAPLPGPTPAQMLAAAEQPPMQQNSMITGMVERLAERLKKDGSDLNGWVRLVHSYNVLGDADKQKAAVADARRALASDPAKLKQFDAELEKIESGANPTAVPAVPPAAGTTPLPGPTPAQMLAAAQQPAAQQDATIRAMVERLAERLKKDGSDLDGWVRLVRSYEVLGEADKAKAAVADAQRAFANDPAKSKQLEAALKASEGSASAAPAAAGAQPQQSAQGAAPGTTGQHADETIDVMVEHLHERLKKQGDNPEGWLMLARSYLTLKQNDKAMAAVKDARKALAADPEKLQQFEAALKHFKIEAPR